MQFNFQVPRLFPESKATPAAPTLARCGRTWRGQREALSMRGSTARENRETLRTARSGWRCGPRWEVERLNPSMYGAGSLTAE
jgi:hypothetical protein